MTAITDSVAARSGAFAVPFAKSAVSASLRRRRGPLESELERFATRVSTTSGVLPPIATARGDLLSMWTLPMAGLLMLIDSSWWPHMALIGGAVYVDTGGRQAIKLLGYRAKGLRVGTSQAGSLALGVYALFLVAGLLAAAIALAEVTPS